jgi:hypothetical protein
VINKKNVLGKTPVELGTKDAIHTAIVSVRAAKIIQPGERCGINEFGEAEPTGAKWVGVADPFRDSIARGESFWLLLNQDAVPNVQHVWEHPEIEFGPPKREVVLNKYIEPYSKTLGVTYSQLMDACAEMVKHDRKVSYCGTLTAEQLESAQYEFDWHDLWYEWKNETGYEFENHGSACCPEYDYPDGWLFRWDEATSRAHAAHDPEGVADRRRESQR